MKPITVLFVSSISILLLTSCEKDYMKESDLFASDGYITANITGESTDGYILDESFTADQYSSSDLTRGAIYRVEDESLWFSINLSENYLDNSNFIGLSFTKTENLIHNISFSFYYEKLVNDNQVLQLYMYISVTSSEITNLEFDEATGLLTGNYSVTSITIVNPIRTLTATGEFQVKVREVVHK